MKIRKLLMHVGFPAVTLAFHKTNPLNFLDDPDIYDGAHVSVQVIGRRLQEEKILALAEFIGNAI